MCSSLFLRTLYLCVLTIPDFHLSPSAPLRENDSVGFRLSPLFLPKRSFDDLAKGALKGCTSLLVP